MSERQPIETAVSLAREVLGGKLDILNGCYLLTRQMNAAALDRDPDFTIFVVVESESDHLPYRAEDRRHWDAEALKRKDEEISKISAFYRENILVACHKLVERFGGPPISENLG